MNSTRSKHKATFSRLSLERLAQCHPLLREIAHELINVMDVIVLCGYRNEEDQAKAKESGRSQLHFPNSRHNQVPSLAMDIAPYPVNYTKIPEFERMCGAVEAIASMKGIKVRMGRDFSFKDYAHFELLI